ncbi:MULTISPECIES: hypothetical protein [Kribbella]|nr:MULTISPECIES: hypothetical protein [Kribbella]
MAELLRRIAKGVYALPPPSNAPEWVVATVRCAVEVRPLPAGPPGHQWTP